MVNEPEYSRPLATVDVVPLALREGSLHVATLQREAAPEAGRSALPGGFVRPEEDRHVEATALRVLRSKAGVKPVHLEQLAVFSGAHRDPRDWSLSVAFLAVVADERDDLLEWAPADDPPALPFDHDHIVAEALGRLRSKAGYSSLPLCFLPEPFTLPQVHGVYETVMDTQLDRAAFRRKILDTGFMEETGDLTVPTGRVARPAKLYRRTDGLRFTPRNFAGR